MPRQSLSQIVENKYTLHPAIPNFEEIVASQAAKQLWLQDFEKLLLWPLYYMASGKRTGNDEKTRQGNDTSWICVALYLHNTLAFTLAAKPWLQQRRLQF